MQKVKKWELRRDWRSYGRDEYVIQVDFISGERMILKLPQYLDDDVNIDDNYVQLELDKAFKLERIDKLKSILYDAD